MRIFKIILSFLFSASVLFTGAQELGISGGLTLGGPLPKKIEHGSEGKPQLGSLFGIDYAYHLSEKIGISSSLGMRQKKVWYGQNYTRDTLIPVDLGIMTAEVPSFYTANVSGEMDLIYLELSSSVSYKINEFNRLSLGIYYANFIAGNDNGTVRVIIGEGGYYDDYIENYNNNNNINSHDFGLNLNYYKKIYKRLYTEVQLSRSLVPLYQNPINGVLNKLYHTYVYFKFGYNIISR